MAFLAPLVLCKAVPNSGESDRPVPRLPDGSRLLFALGDNEHFLARPAGCDEGKAGNSHGLQVLWQAASRWSLHTASKRRSVAVEIGAVDLQILARSQRLRPPKDFSRFDCIDRPENLERLDRLIGESRRTQVSEVFAGNRGGSGVR